MRVVSIVFWAYRSDLDDPIAGSDAADSRLIAVDQALSSVTALAFDHRRILRDAVETARQHRWPGSVQ
jgi:8-oxo-dGTP diphosphatase